MDSTSSSAPLADMGDAVAPAPGPELARLRAVYAVRGYRDSRYSWFNRAHVLAVQERERQVLEALERHGCESLEEKRIIEFGCGTGLWLREFVKWGARPENITGLDLIPDRVREARTLCPSGVKLACGDAAAFKLPSNHFDVVVQATVFTSILDPGTRQRMASAMCRAVKTDGLILWYDFRVGNPRNADVRGVSRREISALFPGCDIDLRPITLAPPVLRLLAPYSSLACHLLAQIPWLCTHYLGAIRKRQSKAEAIA